MEIPPLASRTTEFHTRDIGYFDPNPQALLVETKDNYNIYYNVFSFINRIRVKAIMDVIILR